MSVAFLSLCRRHIFFLSLMAPIVYGQRFGEAPGQALKAQLLANLNRYSGQGEREGEGPMESLGARTEVISDTMPTTFATESPTDPLSSLLALFRPSPVPSPPLFFSPLIPPVTAPPPSIAAAKSLPRGDSLHLSDRRYAQQKPTALPSEYSLRPFPIKDSEEPQQKKNKDKWGGRRAAEVIGEWRRRMYKVLKSARRQKSGENKANSGEKGTAAEDGAGADQLQHIHHQKQQQNPLVLFGPLPSAVIDARKANNLARLFGVENTRNGTAGRGTAMVPLRKHLHSSELRTMAGAKVPKIIIRKTTTTTTTMAPQKKRRNEEEEEEGEGDIYTDGTEEEEQRETDKSENNEKEEKRRPKDDDDREGEREKVPRDNDEREREGKRRSKDDNDRDEGFEIIYLPALKTTKNKLKAKASTTKRRGDREDRQTTTEQRGQQTTIGGRQSSLIRLQKGQPTFASPSPSSAAAPLGPIFPVLSVPSASNSVPSNSVLSNSVPSTLLPLQFPTLLPPIVPSLSVLPPPSSPVQLSNLLSAKPFSTIPPLPPSQSTEGDYLRELENVSEDYVDEQERKPNFLRLPCLRDRSSPLSSASLFTGRPSLLSAVSPPGCPKKEMALPGRREQPTAAVVKTPQTGIFFEASSEEAEGNSHNILWEENREMCNSARLRALIKRSVVPSSVEKSKRRLQQHAEQQFGIFYNVICGTGFFSYIAHTDEFCLMAVHDMNCYVFSPVCSSPQMPISSEQTEKRKNQRKKVFNANSSRRRRRRTFVNRN